MSANLNLTKNPNNLVSIEKCDILPQARRVMFPDNIPCGYLPSGFENWTEDHLKNVRYYLIEFVANYKKKNSEEDIMPSTLKSYVLGIQRSFKQEWKYEINLFRGPIFDCPDHGLMAVLDNKARRLQIQEMHTVSHNVLSQADLKQLYNSKSLSKDSPGSYLTRLVVTVGLVTALRPSALAALSVKQVIKTQLDGKVVYKIVHAMGSRFGASKTSKGGFSTAGAKPVEVFVFDEWYMDRSVNLFQDIDEYLDIRGMVEPSTERFFLAVNHKAMMVQNYFIRQPVGKNTFGQIVKRACIAEGISGLGGKLWVTNHSLRGTLASILFEAGHSNSSVAMRTGHRQMQSLKSYQNLRGGDGLRQQRDLLGSAQLGDTSAVDDTAVKKMRVDGGGNQLSSTTTTTLLLLYTGIWTICGGGQWR